MLYKAEMENLSKMAEKGPFIETSTGTVMGLRDETTGQLKFLGIPYAEPPVGALRFKPTVPKRPWEGVFEATRFGNAGPQIFDHTEGSYEEFMDVAPGADETDWVGSEDNLTLNIWTPALDGKKRPVMIWIHGGANWLESSRLATYHGDKLVARGDVVFVSLNYRLGMFGWLDLSVLGGDEYAGSYANGMRDQVTALKWIRDNIGAFGGDADNITVMGESAGSMDTSWLLTSGHLDGIARRVVLMSGISGLQGLSGDLVTGATPEAAKAKTRMFFDKLGITDMQTLLDMPTVDLMNRFTKLVKASDTLFDMDSLFCQGHTLAGFAPVDPFNAVKQGGTRGIDVMIGYTGYEMGLWLFWDDQLDKHPCLWSAERVFDLPGDKAKAAAAHYDKVFAHDTEGSRGMHLMGDSIFAIPSVWFADQAARHGAKVWLYQFDKETDGRRRALHAADQTYMFNKHETHAGESLLDQPKDEAERQERLRLTYAMQDAVLSFAIHGDPNKHNNPDMPAWPQHTPDTRAAMSFNVPCKVVMDPTGPRREWWYENVYTPALG